MTSICGIYFKNKPIPNIINKLECFTLGQKNLCSTYKKSNLYVKIGMESVIGIIYDNNTQLLCGNIFKNRTNATEITNNTIYDKNDLLKNYWGDYVLITINSDEIELFVSPFSNLQLFYYDCLDYIMFATQISYLLSFHKLKLDEKYLHLFLLNGDFISNYTPFENIKEVKNGHSMYFSNKNKVSCQKIWKYPEIEKFNSELQICNSLNNVVSSYSSKVDSIFLELSGGVDSSSILFALNQLNHHKKNNKIYALNLFDKHISSSNELKYVLALKNSVDFELITIDYEQCLPYSRIDVSNFLPNKPSITFSHLKKEKLLVEIAENNANNYLFMNGHGGDSAFMCPPLTECLLDIVFDKKSRLFMTKLKELAIYYRTTVWSLLAECFDIVLKHYNIKSNLFVYNKIAPWYFNKSGIQNILYESSFYINKNKEIYLPGKRVQMNNIDITLASTLVNLKGCNQYSVFPFLSQPVIECALNINTYDSFKHNYDRHAFRTSISNFFNTEAVWRNNKGETTGVFHRSLNANKDYIYELCMDGYIANNLKLIDKKVLERYIQQISKGVGDFQWSLDHLMCMEIFINSWHNYDYL